MPKENKSIKTIQSIDRALDILETFGREDREIGVTDLSKRLGLNKGTTHGIIQTLAFRGYLVQNSRTGEYKLGMKLFELGTIVQNDMDLRAASVPYLQQLVDRHGETVHLVILDEGEVVYVDKRENPQSMRIVSQVGRRLPAYCTGVGKSILAGLPEEEINKYLAHTKMDRFTVRTITDPIVLMEHLREIRQAGYSIDNEEISEGLCCVAASIRDYSGKPIGAISVAGPTVRMTDDKIEDIKPNIMATAQQISAKLGYSARSASMAE